MLRFRIFGLLLCGLMLVGCSKNSAQPEATKTIGYSALTLTNPFFMTIKESMESEAAKHGYQLLVVSGERDPKKQSDQVDDFIVKEVDAIILNPCDKSAVGPAIKKANEAGIPVFTNDLAYVGSDGKVVCHVATDNLQGGRLAGEAMVKLLGEAGGKVAIIDFPQAESCQLRVAGFEEILAAHNKQPNVNPIEVVSKTDGGGVRDEGNKAARDALESNPDLAAVFAINDLSALGAYAALKAAGKTEQVKIIGFDGELAGKQAIRDGKIVCDPIQYPDQIGAKTIEMLMKYLAGDDIQSEMTNGQILIPSKLYYKADADVDPALQN
ncbi:MAG: substrate-binding domain-containing protein [Pirellulaceae bacterium]|nr:substrate-binding domain-containing protein [Pirellulaceae bacterium]